MAGVKDDPSNFEDRFDPVAYLTQYYHKPGTPPNYYRDLRLKMLHDFFSELIPDEEDDKRELKVLDYGSGPVIAFAISAAGKSAVSQIILAEYTELNRSALQQWLDRDASAYDWSLYFEHVVQDLEKKVKSCVKAREERLRRIVKLVSCDIKADKPIEDGFEGPYDVVITFVAVESACKTENDYFKLIEKLARLVKPQGHMLMFAKLAKEAQSIFYNVGGKQFHYYATSEKVLWDSLREAGFAQIRCTRVSVLNASSGLSKSEIAKLEAHPCTDDEFFYMSVTAQKCNS